MKLRPLWFLLLCLMAMAPAEIQTQKPVLKGDSNREPARKAPPRFSAVQASAKGLPMPQSVAPRRMEGRAIPPSTGAGTASVPKGDGPVGIRTVHPERWSFLKAPSPRRVTSAAPFERGLARLPAASRSQLSAYGKLPLTFEANQGQADPQVRFLSRGSGYSLFLTSSEAILRLQVADDRLRRTRLGAKELGSPSQIPHSELRNQQSTVLRMKLVGANPDPQVEGVDPLPGKSNYFFGSDPKQWRTNIPSFARVRYREVYPGVDLVYYGHQCQLEYDLLVAPGADPNLIHLAFKGAEEISVDPQGDLVLQVAGNEIRSQSAPRGGGKWIPFWRSTLRGQGKITPA